MINSISTYHRQELFHYLILRLYSGAGLFAREITNVLTGKRLVLTRVALVIRFLHIVHRLGLSQFKLCISETVTTHFLQLNKQLLERFCLTSFFRNADSLEAVLEFEELGIIRIETYRRSLRFHRYLLKAVVEHTTNELVNNALTILSQRTFQFIRQLRMKVLYRNHRLLCLFIRSDSNGWLAVEINRI